MRLGSFGSIDSFNLICVLPTQIAIHLLILRISTVSELLPYNLCFPNALASHFAVIILLSNSKFLQWKEAQSTQFEAEISSLLCSNSIELTLSIDFSLSTVYETLGLSSNFAANFEALLGRGWFETISSFIFRI